MTTFSFHGELFLYLQKTAAPLKISDVYKEQKNCQSELIKAQSLHCLYICCFIDSSLAQAYLITSHLIANRITAQ